MKTREKILKLLKKRGIAANDAVLEALDAFLFEVQEQVPGAPGDDDDEEAVEGDDEDDDEDDEDADADEDADDLEEEDEEDPDAQVKADVIPGAALGIDALEDEELFGGAVTKGGRGKGAAAKKASKDAALDVDEEEEGEPERTLVRQVTCPHCGESMPVVLDLSGGDQDDIQDCEVCCSPMRITYTVSQGTLRDFSVEAS